jgi:hypothetical protein
MADATLGAWNIADLREGATSSLFGTYDGDEFIYKKEGFKIL